MMRSASAMPKIHKRWIGIVLFIAVFLFSSLSFATAAPAPAPVAVYTTLPWLTEMSRFIVGTTVKILPLTDWGGSGALKTLRRPPQGAVVIALDPKDAARYGLKPGGKNQFLLYDNLPVPDEKRGFLSFDPSVLPFLSQRLLIVLCEIEPENYSFYQRRLAEFQSRLESALEVGRSLIPQEKMLDLTGSTGPWVRAAVSGAVRPPDDLWAAWAKGARVSDLTMALEEAKKRSWWIVIDAWTPSPVRSRVMGAYQNIYIKTPARDQDFFTYLHDIYLQIWSAVVRK